MDAVTSQEEAWAIFEAARRLAPLDVGPASPVSDGGSPRSEEKRPSEGGGDVKSAEPPRRAAPPTDDGIWYEAENGDQTSSLRDKFHRLQRKLDPYRRDGVLG